MPRNTRSQRWSQRWRRMPPWGKVSIVTGVVVGVTGSVTGVRAAWSTLVLGLPAPIFYVDNSIATASGKLERKMAENNLLPILRDIQIEGNEGKRSAAKNAIDNLKLERAKTSDPAFQSHIDSSIREKENEIDRLNEQFRTLNRLKAQGQ